LAARFALIADARVNEVDVWDVPAPSAYYEALRKFKQGAN
jgi:hypothetical protein